MIFFHAFLTAVAAVKAAQALSLPAGIPTNVLEFRNKHPYDGPTDDGRKVVTIRSSNDEWDDVSEEFRRGVLAASQGGTLYLPSGALYVIGRALDLTGLEDIHVHLDGEIRVRNMAVFFYDVVLTRLFAVHEQCRILARKCLVSPLPKVNYVLEVGR